MKKTTEDAVTMLGIADAVILVEDSPAGVRILLFRRKKQREKQRT